MASVSKSNRYIQAARPLIIAGGLLLVWQMVVWIAGTPAFILPGPALVLDTWIARAPLILSHAGTTLAEIILGLLLGVTFGLISASLLASVRAIRPWLLPILVVSQAIPVFALAPILVLWLGYGMASKVAMAALIIFFPVTAALYDGLRRVEPVWLDSARTLDAMAGGFGAFACRRPCLLSPQACGLRPPLPRSAPSSANGRVVGRIGYLMLHANGRMQIDDVRPLFTLVMAVAPTRRWSDTKTFTPWQVEDHASSAV